MLKKLVHITFINIKVRKEAKIRNQCNQVQCTTPDTGHTHESQEANPFPAGNHKAAMNRYGSMTETKRK